MTHFLTTTLKHIVLNVLVLRMLSPLTLIAGEYEYKSISIAVGTSNIREDDFRSVEIRGSSSLPCISCTYIDDKYQILPMVNFSLGAFKQGEETDLLSTLTSGIILFTLNKKINLDAAGGLAFLSDEKIGEHNFGGYVQFALHTGIHYRLTNNLFFGYRFFHISDAGIFDGNGLNRHLVEIGYAF